MMDQVRIGEIFRKVVAPRLQINPGPCEIRPLTGDASNRRYYRLMSADRDKKCSVILMVLDQPEQFKASEEAVSPCAVTIHELPFINILRHLEASRVAVPRLYHHEKKEGWLFLEDLGDKTLWKGLENCDLRTTRDWYRLAIDELLKIQFQATRSRDDGCLAFGRAFDQPLLMWEFDHFIEYGIEARQDRAIASADRKTLRTFFERISRTLAAEPRCLTHRDYHSRNLMLCEGSIRVLDFQDALMGPYAYDLASLLRDSYVALPEETVDELVDYYLDRRQSIEGQFIEPAQFRKSFDYISLQRNLKAAGRFAYIHAVKKNSNYLPFIPRTLSYVRENLIKYPELRPLREVLSRYVEALK